MEQEGRGRLSSIDLLPETADDDLVWVSQELYANKRLQKDILKEFNARLADKGIGSISVGAFSRYSVKKSMKLRRRDERARMSTEILHVLGSKGSNKLTLSNCEKIKVEIDQALDDENLSPKDLATLTRANQVAVKTMMMAEELRRLLYKSKQEAREEEIDEVGKEAGLTDARISVLRRKFLGVKDPDAKP